MTDRPWTFRQDALLGVVVPVAPDRAPCSQIGCPLAASGMLLDPSDREVAGYCIRHGEAAAARANVRSEIRG